MPTPLPKPLPRTGYPTIRSGLRLTRGGTLSVGSWKGILAETERVMATPDQVFVAGDGAAFSWTVQLTTKHGRSVTFEGIDVIQVNDQGKIQTLHAYWDPAPVLAVLQG